MDSPHIYDKAKYHLESVEQYGLSGEHAANHTIFFLRWLIEHNLMSEFFLAESAGVVDNFRLGSAGIQDVYAWWDYTLDDEMLSEEGNAFAMAYFDFEEGQYLDDYIATLQRDLPTEFHVDYTQENYQNIRQVIDRRYSAWKAPRRKWWYFGRR